MSVILLWQLFFSFSWALVKQEAFVVPPPQSLIEKIDKAYDRRAKQNERIFMNETFQEYFKRAHPGEVFKTEKYRKEKDTLENSDLTQSWRDEVALSLEGKTIPKVVYLTGTEDFYQHFYAKSDVAQAKKIAMAKMYESIVKDWNKLKDTVFNDQDLSCPVPRNCPALDEVILKKKMPETFFFSYPLSSRRNNPNYVFEFQGVGFVEVNKQNLKSGRVIFGISYLNDNNRPEKGFEKLRTDVDAGIAPPPAAAAPENTPAKEPENAPPPLD